MFCCVFFRSWPAKSVDSGCSNSTAPCSEGLRLSTGGRCDQTPSRPSAVKVRSEAAAGSSLCPLTKQGLGFLNRTLVFQVDTATMTESPFPEPVRVRPKERGSRWGHASPFMRGSTIVRSQTFSPGARNQYVCRLYRSDSDSSTLPKKSPFVRNTLERRTLRYKQVKPPLLPDTLGSPGCASHGCLCAYSNPTTPPWLSSQHAPPWTWSWTSRPAGLVRSS